jgi:hypothetical protein
MSDHSGFDGGQSADPFSKMWFDMMSKLATGGFSPSSSSCSPMDEAAKQMRQAFFDAWQQQCEEFMRSEPFLAMMKRGMDNALAFREQLNEFLTKALHHGQMPARSDTDAVLLVLRSLEERLLERIDQLTERVERLESRGVESSSGVESKRRPKEAPK